MIRLHAQEVATLRVGTFVLVLKLVGKAVLFFNAVIGKASVEGPYRNHEADDEEHESDVCEGFAKVEEAQGAAEQGEDGCEATEQL